MIVRVAANVDGGYQRRLESSVGIVVDRRGLRQNRAHCQRRFDDPRGSRRQVLILVGAIVEPLSISLSLLDVGDSAERTSWASSPTMMPRGMRSGQRREIHEHGRFEAHCNRWRHYQKERGCLAENRVPSDLPLILVAAPPASLSNAIKPARRASAPGSRPASSARSPYGRRTNEGRGR